MTDDCATDDPVRIEASLRPAHIRFVAVLVVQGGIAFVAVANGNVSFGGVIPWRVAEWTTAALIASVFVVKFSRSETGPVFAVADDLLPAITLLAVVLALATLAEHQNVLAIETFGLGLSGLAVMTPRMRRDPLPGWTRDAPRITLGVANVLAGNATPQRTAAELVHSGVDVLVINEVTDTLLACIDDLGGKVWFPHRMVDTGADPLYVTAVFSHRPFGASSGVAIVGPLRIIRAELDVDGVPLTLIATHLEANLEPGGHPRWRAQVAALTGIAARATTRTIIAGDLNASVDRPPLDELLERGYTDAHDALGRGLDNSLKLAPSGPLAALGPVARVDHVLTGSDVRPVDITRLRAPGSDHVPFAVTLAVRQLAQ